MHVLVIGAGVMGSNHARTLNELKDARQVTVVDKDENALKKIRERGFEKIRTNSDLNAAIAAKPDAAIIAVPTRLHYAVADALLDAGIPLLVEKPLADSVDDAHKLVAKAEKKKTTLAVGHIERFNPAVQALKKHVHDIGAVVHASAHRFGIPTPRDVDSSFIDQAVHDIDVIAFLTNNTPTHVQAVQKRFLDAKYDDSCTAIYEFDSFTATVEANRVTPIKTRELIVTGLKGSARLDYITQDLTITKADHETTKYNTFDEIVLRIGRGTEIKPYFTKEEPLKLEDADFLRAVKNNTRPMCTGIDGLHALAMVTAGIQAAKTGKKQEIKY